MQEQPKARHPLHLRTVSILFLVLALALMLSMFWTNARIRDGFSLSEEANRRYLSARFAAQEMESASDYLTSQCRCFVMTGDREFLTNYLTEIHVTRRRDQAVEDLGSLLEQDASGAYQRLSDALKTSNELTALEYHAMRLRLEADGQKDGPQETADVLLTEEEAAMDPQAMLKRAETLLFGDEYLSYKETIRENVRLCTRELIDTSEGSVRAASDRMNRLLTIQQAAAILMALAGLMLTLLMRTEILIPLRRMVKKMRAQEAAQPEGVAELRFVTGTYNEMLEKSRQEHKQLSYEASHDGLTGLYNRSAYEMFRQSVPEDHLALILMDVDDFKHINDSFGHDMGDKVLRRVAEVLKESFRSTDIICRIGGDEFVVLMTRVDSGVTRLVLEKTAGINRHLKDPSAGTPPISLSIGIAFSDREHPQGDLFKDADTACYRAKQSGKNNSCVFPDIMLPEEQPSVSGADRSE